MQEDALAIFDYLPIRQSIKESEYVNHLWRSFSTLSEGDDIAAAPFAIMPFHLLFMITLQYKVLRIYREQKEKYELALIIKNPRREERDILMPESPLTLAFLSESELVDLLKIIGLSAHAIQSIKKKIIRYRNDKIAHARGYIEQEIDKKISEYLGGLELVQKSFENANQYVAKTWLLEMQSDDDVETFIESRLLDSCLSKKDLNCVIPLMLVSDKISDEQSDLLKNYAKNYE